MSENPQGATYYGTDTQGSVIDTSDAKGTVLWVRHYVPFGKPLAKVPKGQAVHIGYLGQPSNDETGLGYFDARYYDPEVGRFLSVDPVGLVLKNPMSLNRYLYGNDNPYRYNE